jgi:hypothetical protein
MANPTQAELDAIHAKRRSFFTLNWVRRMWAAEVPLGEAFWIGHFAVQLALLPLWLLMVLAQSFLPGPVGQAAIFLFFGLQVLWHASVTQAVLRIAPRAAQAGIWRWIGALYSVINTLGAAYLFYQWMTGAL